MTDFAKTISEFQEREAARAVKAEAEIAHLKQAVLGPLSDAEITRVEVRFDGCGDSGAVEGCECFAADMTTIACPEVAIAPFDFEVAREPTGDAPLLLCAAIESLTYLALERFHPGWEINDGSCGMLVIEVPEADFVLECSLRYTGYDEHFTGL